MATIVISTATKATSLERRSRGLVQLLRLNRLVEFSEFYENAILNHPSYGFGTETVGSTYFPQIDFP
jgi:hypothetical protein